MVGANLPRERCGDWGRELAGGSSQLRTLLELALPWSASHRIWGHPFPSSLGILMDYSGNSDYSLFHSSCGYTKWWFHHHSRGYYNKILFLTIKRGIEGLDFPGASTVQQSWDSETPDFIENFKLYFQLSKLTLNTDLKTSNLVSNLPGLVLLPLTNKGIFVVLFCPGGCKLNWFITLC